MNNNLPTTHIEAGPGEIAKTVIMPGDPLRAKFIADNFLSDVVCFNKVRGMLGFTGKYKGVEVSVMGHGMGIPSMGIYSYELFKYYDVDNIIRVGSCGSVDIEVNVKDIVLAQSAHSYSTYAMTMNGDDSRVMLPSEELNEKIRSTAKSLDIQVHYGPVYCGDVFYVDESRTKDDLRETVEAPRYKGREMESFALFANAKELGKNAACLLTCSDHRVKPVVLTSGERQKSFKDMMKIALETAINL